MDINALVKRLANWYWSPELPSTYVIPDNGKMIGVGNIAFSRPGAFNLAWANADGKWETREDQEALVTSFSRYRSMEGIEIDGQDILTWACMLSMSDYFNLIEKSQLSRECKARILTPKFILAKNGLREV